MVPCLGFNLKTAIAERASPPLCRVSMRTQLHATHTHTLCTVQRTRCTAQRTLCAVQRRRMPQAAQRARPSLPTAQAPTAQAPKQRRLCSHHIQSARARAQLDVSMSMGEPNPGTSNHGRQFRALDRPGVEGSGFSARAQSLPAPLHCHENAEASSSVILPSGHSVHGGLGSPAVPPPL